MLVYHSQDGFVQQAVLEAEDFQERSRGKHWPNVPNDRKKYIGDMGYLWDDENGRCYNQEEGQYS